ncbi:putative DNA polymerase III epsilon subunit protein [Rhizobium phage RHph_TM40]|uniref:Putative DNA polymerase III epsilon subunit protein n=1 Tax=Rhizobium phage RHph_TM30 TaxID=2509764 RepID=A0A7S5R576_9CAUD|nr:putative DNA polymerase III epsilon subunit protein [Rhizobium phage RHph_TM30]QIG71342.1 putative DNA polymerase III epsilon subunit protein [Rhizobium phage RHph_TM30]QIG71706.1 putative DNA polymerase III epsilon subunit protein [Rhizobium phage RHph_TM40]QIG72431.1 putative DNA polymerase III epsilon subunit protein [Rhizobium phage RHph_TM3_3_6]
MNLESMKAALEESGKYMILDVYKYQDKYNENIDNRPLRLVSVIDTETTGLDSKKDSIINLGIVNIEVDDDGNIYRVVEGYNGFEQPRYPIPPHITDITGITDDLVKGHKFDYDKVNKMLDASDLVIAHNAGFDRPFVDDKFTSSTEKIWACSLEDVPWKAYNFGSKRLIDIAIHFGFYYNAHRAISDVMALVHILSKKLDGTTMMSHMLDSISKSYVMIYALEAPFETKDLLKAKRYKWDFVRKSWYKIVPTSVSMFEKEFLEREIYDGSPRYQITPLPRNTVYSTLVK